MDGVNESSSDEYGFGAQRTLSTIRRDPALGQQVFGTPGIVDSMLQEIALGKRERNPHGAMRHARSKTQQMSGRRRTPTGNLARARRDHFVERVNFSTKSL